jgi:mono/diheme cytochrome c family protein
MKIRRLLAQLIVVLGLGAAAFLAGCASPSIMPAEPTPRPSFDRTTVEKGAQLAAIGNCMDCHTASAGRPYAGGRPVKTPFGIIHGTNITPDPDTGIGRWPQAAFLRAMREGLDREGRHLYPAFPYDHYTRLSDEDIAALYAFLMTREPVRAATPPNRLAFPFNIRSLIGAWKRLYLEPGVFQRDPAQSAQWNRGAYLVQGLGHCGACHTPRNFLGAEKKKEFFAGGESDGWHAPALNADSRAPEPWTGEYLYRYLRGGLAERHDVPAGPMAPVVHNLAAVPEEDVRAIAAYVAAQMGPARPERRAGGDEAARSAVADGGERALRGGAAVYTGACAACHDGGRLTPSSGNALQLQLSTAVNLPAPGNFIRIVLEGITPRDGERGPWMPGFAGALTDAQLAELTAHVRSKFGKGPLWRDLEDEVKKIRREKEK